MSFLQRECDRISDALDQITQADFRYRELHAAQQALAWVNEVIRVR